MQITRSFKPLMKKLLCIAIVAFSAFQPMAVWCAGALAQGTAIGDRPIVIPEGKSAVPVPDALAHAGQILGQALNNQTTTGSKAAAIAEQAKALVSQKPSWAAVFCGLADEQAQTPEEAQIESLTNAGKTLAAAGTRVYFVPSSPSLRAATVANLRIAADAAGAVFVDTGTGSAGQPYDEVLTRIRKAEEERQQGPPSPSPSPQTQTELGEEPPWAASATAAIKAAERATTVTATVVEAAGTTGAIISMRPPVPLKQFDPVERYKTLKQGKKGKGKKPAVAP